jgi:hypothetical protein
MKTVRGGAVPVPFAWRCEDRVARPHRDNTAAAGLDEAMSIGHVYGLAHGVTVPGTASARGEADHADPRDGSTPLTMTSNQASPVNVSGGAFAVGCFSRKFMVSPSEFVYQDILRCAG